MDKIVPKTPGQLNRMRQAGRIVAEVLKLLELEACAGITTGDLDRIAEEAIADRGAKAAFKGYRGFPASICTSINSEVVHGIPGNRELCDGDLLSIDVGVFWEGMAGDAAVTFPVGQCSESAMRLISITNEAMEAALDVIRPGVKVIEISRAIENVAAKARLGIVHQYTGHGIGAKMHESPQIPNIAPRGIWHRSPSLPKGATIAIEPMLTGGCPDVKTLEDGWTVVTADNSLASHVEHTVSVGPDGPVLMTVV